MLPCDPSPSLLPLHGRLLAQPSLVSSSPTLGRHCDAYNHSGSGLSLPHQYHVAVPSSPGDQAPDSPDINEPTAFSLSPRKVKTSVNKREKKRVDTHTSNGSTARSTAKSRPASESGSNTRRACFRLNNNSYIRSPKLSGYRDVPPTAADRLTAYLRKQSELDRNNVMGSATRVLVGPAGCLQAPALQPRLSPCAFEPHPANRGGLSASLRADMLLFPPAPSGLRRASETPYLRHASDEVSSCGSGGGNGGWEFPEGFDGEFPVLLIDLGHSSGSPVMVNGNSAFCEMVDKDPWCLAGASLQEVFDVDSVQAILRGSNVSSSASRTASSSKSEGVTPVHYNVKQNGLRERRCAFAFGRNIGRHLALVVLPAPGSCTATEKQMRHSRSFRAISKRVFVLLHSDNMFEEAGLA